MILLLLDLLIYNFTTAQTYLVLLNFSYKKKISTLFLIALILDFILFSTLYKNLFVFLILFLLNHFVYNYDLKNLVHYLSVQILNYSLFIFLSMLLSFNFSFSACCNIIVEHLLLNFIIWILFYYKFINKT